MEEEEEYQNRDSLASDLITESEVFLKQIQYNEMQRLLKRKWLLEIPLSESEKKQCDFIHHIRSTSKSMSSRSKFDKSDSESYSSESSLPEQGLISGVQVKLLPESFVRGDDIFYETVKSQVQAALGAPVVEPKVPVVTCKYQDEESIWTQLPFYLDQMSTRGLYCCATTLKNLRRGSDEGFEKTRKKMKIFIKKTSPKVDKRLARSEIVKHFSPLLDVPQNFKVDSSYYKSRWGDVKVKQVLEELHGESQSHRFHVIVDVEKILDGLEELPLQTLFAMKRALEREVKGKQCKFQIHEIKSGVGKDRVIASLRNSIKPEPQRVNKRKGGLVEALTVVGLWNKVVPVRTFYAAELADIHYFEPDVKVLQEEIAQAIKLVKNITIGIPKLRELKTKFDTLSGGNRIVSDPCLQTAVENVLTEYLFEVGHMDAIPVLLKEIVDFINKQATMEDEEIEEQVEETAEELVECIMNISAQAKQVVWDTLPDSDLNSDFAEAYVDSNHKELGDTDSSDDDDSNHNSGAIVEQGMSGSPSESMDDNNHNSGSLEEHGMSGSTSKSKASVERHQPACDPRTDTEEDPLHVEPEVKKNQYLHIQGICDDASIITYNLIDHMVKSLDLDTGDQKRLRGDCATQDDSQGVEKGQTSLSQKNNDRSLLVRAVEELMPTFPKSGMEALRR